MPIEFWFDFASTYSYPAALRIEALAQANDVALRWRPFLLGPIFHAQGWNDSPFNLYPAKGRYMWRDLERLCDAQRISLRKPSQFPRNSVLAARVACHVADQPWAGDFIRAVYRANFAEDRDIAQPGVIAACLDALGQPGQALIDAAQSPAHKDALRRQTEAAKACGIFGAPTVMVGDEMFWGNDRLEAAIAWHRAHAPR